MQLQWVHPEAFHERDRLTAAERIEELAAGRSDLIDVRISAQTTSHHRHGHKEVRITCAARGKEIVAARSRSDAGLALNEALDVFEREVRRMRDRRSQQRPEAVEPAAELGVIDRVIAQEGYGFILTDAGEQVYFHRNAVRGGLDFERLAEGERIALDFEAGEQGPHATVVLPAPPDAAGP
jgi:cold shock CspA family protein/ribosome-associated translation inhibitor RaiA